MKKKKRKLNRKRIILLLLIIILVIYFYLKFSTQTIDNISSNLANNISKIANNSNYKTIKQDANNNYSGIGQEKIKDKDGYFTTFTTIDNHKKTYKEYKQNGNSSWSKKEYWGGTMAENGCGITAISTILSGYGKNYTPENLRKKYFPVMDSNKISGELSKTFGIKNSDFYYDSLHLSKYKLKSHLETNRPILICVWNKPNKNRWTTSSHYMVLLAADGKDMVYISNPNRWRK